MLTVYDGRSETESEDGMKKKTGTEETYAEEDVGKNIYNLDGHLHADSNC